MQRSNRQHRTMPRLFGVVLATLAMSTSLAAAQERCGPGEARLGACFDGGIVCLVLALVFSFGGGLLVLLRRLVRAAEVIAAKNGTGGPR